MKAEAHSPPSLNLLPLAPLSAPILSPRPQKGPSCGPPGSLAHWKGLAEDALRIGADLSSVCSGRSGSEGSQARGAGRPRERFSETP